MLAHKAEEEGIAVAEYLTGHSAYIDYNAIPSVVYTYPEVASVGMTEEQLKKDKIDYKTGVFQMSANSWMRANIDETSGIVKVIVDKKTNKILGGHIVAPNAGELIQELVLGIQYGASSEDIAWVSHAHPGMSEAVKEACMAAHFKAINC